MRNLLVLSILSIAVLGCNGSGGGGMSAISGKPEDTVKAFVDAVGKGDGKTAMDCLLVDNPDVASVEALLKTTPIKLEAKDYKVEMKEPYLASVSFNLNADLGAMAPASSSADHVSVLYTQGKWKILPMGLPGTGQQMSLSAVASMLEMSGIFRQARQAAQKTVSLSNAKQIATAVIMYAGDYDDGLPLQANVTDSIQPYLKNREIYTAPGDPKGTLSYSFNEKVLGKSMTSVVSPATTVLLYEGKDHQLHFAHEGKAAVAFCDGHARMVGPTDTLNWDPTK